MQSLESFGEVVRELLDSFEEYSRFKAIISDRAENARDAAEALYESLDDLCLALEDLPD